MYRSILSTALGTFAAIIALVILTNPIACSSSDGEGGVQLTVSNLGKDVSLTSGEMQEISFSESYDVQRYGGPFSSLTMDLQAHLSAITISAPNVVERNIPFPLHLVKTANAAIDGSQLFIRIARAEQEATVCTDGELYGPFDISLADNFQPESVTPSSAEATQQTLDVINTGAYSICVQILPLITGIADLNSLDIDFGSCNESAADIQGTWVGTYYCEGICDSATDVLDITLEITQDQNDPSIASYTDSEASYKGRVCGSRFSYSGGVESVYDESGTFVLNADGSASKTSTYLSIGEGSVCSGTCTDTLYRE